MDEVREAAERLLHEAVALVGDLQRIEVSSNDARRSSVADRRVIVARYADALRDALARSDMEAMLRACNSFTTVNKGLSDAQWIDDVPGISDRALAISHLAWSAGDRVRRVVGHL